jgi:hypothetical protein
MSQTDAEFLDLLLIADLDAHLKTRKAQCDIEMCAREVSHERNS